MSIAQLGLSVDSSAAKGAAVDLTALVGASERAEKSQQGLGRSSREVLASMSAMRDVLVMVERNTATMAAGFQKGGAAAETMGRTVEQSNHAAARSIENVTAAERRRAQAFVQSISAMQAAQRATGAVSIRQTALPASDAAQRARDLAAYGTELDRLRAKFNPVFAASKAYEASLDELNMAHRVGAITAREHGAALDLLNADYAGVTVGAQAAEGAIMGAARASRLANHNAQNLSFQLIDIGQSIPLAFQSPIYALQNLGFQMAQIGQIYAGQGGMKAALTDSVMMVGRFAAKMGPAIIAVGAIAGAFAGLTHEINETARVSVSFGDTIKAVFQMLARAVSSVANPIVEVLAPAFSWLWEKVVEGVRFAGNMFITGWKAAIKTSQLLFRGFVDGVYLMTTGLAPALNGVWLDIQGGFKDAIASMADAWGKFIDLAATGSEALGLSSIGSELRTAAVDMQAYASMLNNGADQIGSASDRLYGLATSRFEMGTGLISDAFTNAGLAIERITAQDPMGAIFDAISAQAQANARSRPAGDDDGGGGTSSATDEAAREAERLQEAYDRIVMSGEQFVAQQKLAAHTIGMTAEQANRLRYEFDFLNDAQRAGIELTPEQTARLKDLAGQMASTEASTQALQESFDLARDVTGSFFNDLRSGLESGKGVWASFADAAARAIDRVTNRLLDKLLDAIFKVNSASAGGGGGGGIFGMIGSVLGGLGGLFGGGTSFITSVGPAPSIPNYTFGGFDTGGYTGGRRGQIAGVVHGEEFVVQAGAARRHLPLLQAINQGELGRLPGFASGGFVAPVMPTVPRVSGMADGGGKGTVVNIYGAPENTKVERTQRGGMEQLDVYLDEKVAKALSQPGSRSQLAMMSIYGARQAPIQR